MADVFTHPKLSLRDRFWVYPLGTWMEFPRFPRWRRWVPFFGEDERGYRTVVLPWWRGNLVVAYRRCFDAECLAAHLQYWELLAELD